MIRAKRGRKAKTDRQDALHILNLLVKDDFAKIWVPSWENRDMRQLLWHRHRLVQARTRMMNQLQAIALAFVLIIGKAERFQCGEQISAYLGLVPLEDSSGERRRTYHQATQFSAALLMSRGSASDNPHDSGMAQ